MKTYYLQIKLLFISILFLIPFFGIKAENINLDNNGKNKPVVTLIKSDTSGIVVNVKINSYKFKKVVTPKGNSFILTAPETQNILKKGAPDVPRITTSVIIPNYNKMKIVINNSSFIEIPDVDIAPSKGNLSRTVDPNSVSYTYGKEYKTNSFYPSVIAELGDPYIVRDFRGQSIHFNPYQYNPVTKVLRIYTEITVIISKTDDKGFNVLTKTNTITKLSREFNTIYKRHFINYSQISEKYTPVEENGNMLIVAASDYYGLMQPLVDWKNQKGIPCELVDFADIGTSAATLKNYVQDYYNNNGLTFLLLVGDAEDIPSLYQSGDSDNAYAYVEGNDSYPEFFVGRFSGESSDDILTQINRTIDYEKNPQANASWYSKNTLIASNQGEGQGDDDEADWQHMQNIRPDLMGFTYTSGDELYDGSHGGEDATGDPSPSDVANSVNEGNGIMAYCGHGADQYWVTTGFSNSDVNSLTNDNMLPFIFDVACVNGNFHGQTCFAEAWMRATNGINPTGAIAIIASTINQSWDPPMDGEDEMVDILVESYNNNIKRTFGGIVINGCMLMNDDYGNEGAEMTNTWTVFGDPSLEVRTAAPTEMSVTNNPVIFLGLSSCQITCDTDGATAALTFDGELLGSAKVENGIANININPLSTVGIATLTVTAFNKMPYFDDIDVIPNDGAYVVIDEFNVAEGSEAEYGNDVSFDFTLKNVGNKQANSISGILSSDDEYVTITENSTDFENIDSSATTDFSNKFLVSFANNVPDEHVVSFQLQLTDELDSIWVSVFSIPINAPKLEIPSINIDDNAGGNGNGLFNAGEVIDLNILFENTGHADSKDAILSISTRSDYVNIFNADYNIGTIVKRASVDTTVIIGLDPFAPLGTSVDITFTLVADEYVVTKTINRTIGIMLEDFESGTLNSYPWDTTTTYTWQITNTEVYEGTNAIQSENINSDNEAVLSIQLNVNSDDTISFFKKVSSESGYDFLNFYIDGNKKDSWSGEVDWSIESFPVSSGNHTFKWSYEKDGSVDSGSDCAWIDYVVLPGSTNSGDTTGGNEPDTLEFVSTPDTLARINESYTYNIEISSSDTTTSAFEIKCHTIPEWLTLTDNGDGTAILSGTPDNNIYHGNNDVIVCVSTEKGRAYQLYNIWVQWAQAVSMNSETKENLTIYPNPTTDIAFVDFNLEKKSSIELSVINILGKKIISTISNQVLSKGTYHYEINMTKLPVGIYILSYKENNRIITQKIIKR